MPNTDVATGNTEDRTGSPYHACTTDVTTGNTEGRTGSSSQASNTLVTAGGRENGTAFAVIVIVADDSDKLLYAKTV